MFTRAVLSTPIGLTLPYLYPYPQS